jgi:hypothetical protein
MTKPIFPFYFAVVFWGEKHRNYFLQLLVPSLLSPGNLPALASAPISRFLIVTTTEDWEAIQSHPAFVVLQSLIAPVLLEMAHPTAGANKYLVMSEGHKRVTMKAFADGAYGVFLTPDLVLSDGSVAALQRLAWEGKKVVLCVAMRFTYEGCRAEIEAFRDSLLSHRLVLASRTLAGIAVRNMHPETLRYDWDAPYFAETPFSCFFHVPGGGGILVHSFSWAPLLVSYKDLAEHHAETFDAWTMDGDYIYKNFSEDDVYVVHDSDEILLVSFTPGNDLLGQLDSNCFRPRWYKRFPIVRYFWKIHALRGVRNSRTMDPLKRRIFPRGVRIHSGEAVSIVWEHTEERARAILSRVVSRMSVLEIACTLLVRFVESGAFWPLSLLNRASAVEKFVQTRNCEYTNQSGVGSQRVWLIGPSVPSGKWYWEVFSANLGAADCSVAETACIGVISREHSIVKSVGSGGQGWGWRGDGKKVHAGRLRPYGTAADQRDEVMMVALDMDAGRMWFGRNGIWFGSGNPAAGTYPAFEDVSGVLFPAISSKHGGKGTATLRVCVTGDSWTYSPPSGFHSLTEAGYALKSGDIMDHAVHVRNEGILSSQDRL